MVTAQAEEVAAVLPGEMVHLLKLLQAAETVGVEVEACPHQVEIGADGVGLVVQSAVQ